MSHDEKEQVKSAAAAADEAIPTVFAVYLPCTLALVPKCFLGQSFPFEACVSR